ncbi:hypothetical protein ANCCAN_29609 [Ancylostoma caninum]|uniref:Uncharacterized protein n=1 Tax=Ancylostoma caninum TaxID=29170 RepID=A0A368F115_ANCCA|nr:hypothetical protein ANCCAN_29609 [Ancylostoma caninum]
MVLLYVMPVHPWTCFGNWSRPLHVSH